VKLGADAAAVFGPVLKLKVGVEHMERLMRLAVSGDVPAFSQAGRAVEPAKAPIEKTWFPSMRSN